MIEMLKIRLRLPSHFRHFVAIFCGYELAAIISGKVPTLTELDKRSKHILSIFIFATLAIHFYLDDDSVVRLENVQNA